MKLSRSSIRSGEFHRARRRSGYRPTAWPSPGSHRPLARCAAHRFRPRDPGRPLPAAGRGLPGPVRPRGQLLRRRRRACAADLRLHQPLWFMPATPVLSNGGTKRGLPISCFLNEATDSLDGIVGLWNENVWLASKGGGIGSYWGNLRSIGEKVGLNGKTSGVIPFIRVMDSLTLAISQGSLRRGSAAVYLPVSHPEIEEFIEIRRPTGGDPNRKAPNLHHGILVSDAFMRAVEADEPWALRSPKDKAPWCASQRARAVDPHPDRADRDRRAVPDLLRPREPRAARAPEARRPGGPHVEPVQRDHAADRHRPARPAAHRGVLPVVGQPGDVVRVEGPPAVHRGHHAVPRQRAAGLHRPRAGRDGAGEIRRHAGALGGPGRDGLPQLPAGQNVPFESVIAKVWNKRMFAQIRAQADAASRLLAEERGACPDAAEYGIMERFSNKMAMAPTASISIIAGNCQPGHRADRGQRVPAEDAVRQLHRAQPPPADAAGRARAGTPTTSGRRSR